MASRRRSNAASIRDCRVAASRFSSSLRAAAAVIAASRSPSAANSSAIRRSGTRSAAPSAASASVSIAPMAPVVSARMPVRLIWPRPSNRSFDAASARPARRSRAKVRPAAAAAAAVFIRWASAITPDSARL